MHVVLLKNNNNKVLSESVMEALGIFNCIQSPIPPIRHSSSSTSDASRCLTRRKSLILTSSLLSSFFPLHQHSRSSALAQVEELQLEENRVVQIFQVHNFINVACKRLCISWYEDDDDCIEARFLVICAFLHSKKGRKCRITTFILVWW